MKIITIVGARPQFIKLGPLSAVLRKKHQEIILHTGQHYDQNMSDQFFVDLDIPRPDYNLGIGSESHAGQTAKMLVGMEKILVKQKPDIVVVFGDTNSTLSGSLAASKLHIPIVHVEAGLRSFNKIMPEEINRILTDHCSDILFAPTKTAIDNLTNEGLSSKSHLTGDIMLDSLLTYRERADSRSRILEKLRVDGDVYILLTLHRPYNVDSSINLANVLSVLSDLECKIVFPVHPRTKKMIKEFSIKLNSNIYPINPVSYLDFVKLEMNASKIITDSGGIQKEAYILGIPCITVRPETEWIETVKLGWNTLVGFDSDKLDRAITEFNPVKPRPDIFGKMGVAQNMVKIIDKFFSNINES